MSRIMRRQNLTLISDFLNLRRTLQWKKKNNNKTKTFCIWTLKSWEFWITTGADGRQLCLSFLKKKKNVNEDKNFFKRAFNQRDFNGKFMKCGRSCLPWTGLPFFWYSSPFPRDSFTNAKASFQKKKYLKLNVKERGFFFFLM